MYPNTIINKYLHNKGGSNVLMNDHKKRIIDFIRKSRIVTSSEVAKFIKVSWNTAEKYLLELIIEGKLEKIKKKGVNLWVPK